MAALHNYRSGKSQVVTCFDLSAAFDTLSSDIFCSKLKLYGFDKKSVNWFKTYMQNRKQVVMIGATISDQITTNLGSPQGAIISTTIFIILIADISLWSESLINSYADDTTSTVSGHDFEELKHMCEKEAQNILDFMAVNKLKSNDDKTAILVMRRNQSESQETFKIGNFMVKEVKQEKLLGFIVSNNIKWEEHIKKLVAKLKFRLFSLKRLSKQLPYNLLKKVADGIFMSHVRYGISLYCPIEVDHEYPHSLCIEQLRVAFNDCLRLLTRNSRKNHVSINEMLENLGWLSLNQIASESRLIEAWKTAKFEDYCLNDTLKKRVKNSYSTRTQNQDFFERGVNDLKGSVGFVNSTARIWNQAPEEIRCAKTLTEAKRHIRNYVKTLPVS